MEENGVLELQVGQYVLLDPKVVEETKNFMHYFEGEVVARDSKRITVKWLRQAGRKIKKPFQEEHESQNLIPLVQNYGKFETGKLVNSNFNEYKFGYITTIKAVFKNGIIRRASIMQPYVDPKVHKLSPEVDNKGQLKKKDEIWLTISGHQGKYIVVNLFENGNMIYRSKSASGTYRGNIKQIETKNPKNPKRPILKKTKINDDAAESQSMVSLTTQTTDDTPISFIENNSKK